MEYRFNASNKHELNSQIRTIAELSPSSNFQLSKPGGERLCSAFSPDDTLFAWSCGLREVVIVPWDPTNNCIYASQNGSMSGYAAPVRDSTLPKEHLRIDCGFLVTSLAFGGGLEADGSPSTRANPNRFDFARDLMLAVGHDNGRIRIWDPYTGKLLLELTDHRYCVNSLSVSLDGSLRLASGSDDGTVKLWDLLDGGNMFRTLSDHKRSPVLGLAWSPDSAVLCVVGRKQKVLLYSMEEYILEKRLSGHCHDVTSCSFSPDGAMVATASADTKVIIWDAENGLPLRQLPHLLPQPGLIYMSGSNNHQVMCVKFAPNGLQVASTSSDNQTRFWDLSSPSDEALGSVSSNEDDPMVSCCYSSSGGAISVSYVSGKSCIFAPPTLLPSLLHCSRMAVRRSLGSNDLLKQDGFLPRTLIPFLQYKEW